MPEWDLGCNNYNKACSELVIEWRLAKNRNYARLSHLLTWSMFDKNYLNLWFFIQIFDSDIVVGFKFILRFGDSEMWTKIWYSG